MIQKYKTVSIVYGGSGRQYAIDLNNKIEEFAKTERYPLASKLIMESILTQELLSGVIDLFKESDVCVAFLTADDFCITAYGERRRIRQNIVFELGMAILQLGREKCVLLSDFDVRDTKNFELPSDMNSLEIKCFSPEQIDTVVTDVLKKILKMDFSSSAQGLVTNNLPQYDKLFLRHTYYVDYENIFQHNTAQSALHGTDFLKSILQDWLRDCHSFKHYDERCIFVLERIGFLPLFGKIPEVPKWLDSAMESLEHYSHHDIEYYEGTDLLDFSHSLLTNVIAYTKIKRTDVVEEVKQYQKLLSDFVNDPPPSIDINPLMLITYYDYLGLTYMKLFYLTGDKNYMVKAKDSYDTAFEYTRKVDMSLKIWSGFLLYNLARACADLDEKTLALDYFQKAVIVRRKWLSTSQYNITIRNALSYEYFIAKIDYANTMFAFNNITDDDLHQEYNNIEIELDTYADNNDSLERLIYIRNLLHNSWESREKE